jgi:hypothetical protein
VHHDIDATPVIRRFRYGAFDILKFADIDRAKRRGPTRFLDGLNRCLAMTGRTGGNHYFRPGCSKYSRDSGTDSLAGTRDDRNFVFKFPKH